MSRFESLKCQLLSENKIRFELHTENNDFQQILGVVSVMNLKIKNLSLKEPNLEDIFHKIVK